MSDSSENEGLEQGEEQSSADEEIASGEEDVENEAEEETKDEMQDDGEESGEEELDINASDTESDEDDNDEVDDDEDIPATKKNVKTQSSKIVAKITEAIKERHEKRKGKQLYIRFPEKLPESIEDFQKKVKSLSELIVESHKPRQKHARFCLVDFANTEDRDKALKQISKKDSKIVVSLPKTDNDEFLKTLVDKKIKQNEKKVAKNLMRKQSKKNVTEKSFTSILLVLNLPNTATTAQIKELFPDSVDIQTKRGKGKFTDKMIATITMPSTEAARVNYNRKLELGGNKLSIRFSKNKKHQLKKKNKKASKNATPDEAAQKGPIAPTEPEDKNLDSPKKSAQSPKKRSVSENSTDEPAKKKAKGKKPFPPNKKNNPFFNGKPGGKAKGKKPFPPNKKDNPFLNGKPGGKPNKQHKLKNQRPKKGKAVAGAAE